MRRLLLLPLAATLAACGPAPVQIAVPVLPAEARIPSGFSSVELLEVELPAYADGERIYVQENGIALRRAGGAVWADDPSRAVTLELARALGALTGVPVVPEPSPFDEDAAARLDVRLAEFAPDVTRGAFVIRGLYFVAALDESNRNRAREVAVSAPLPPKPDPAAIAVARAQAVLLLARAIAEDGLR